SFEELKKRLVFAPILTLSSYSGGFQIYSDASKKGLGCVLMQHDLEHYLYGETYDIFTDHKSLKKANVMADALSRKLGMLANLQIEPEIIRDLERMDIELSQKEDVELWAMLQKSEEDEQTKFRVDSDGVMWFGDRLCVPSDPTLREAVNEVGERVIEGPELIEMTNEKVTVAKERLKEARGVRHFGIKGKLSPRFIGPFKILDRVGEVSYRLALPSQLSHVHNVFHVSLLRGYKYHPLHVVSYPLDHIREDLSLVEEREKILDRLERVMRNTTIPFVKIIWKNHPEREATWETKASMQASYPCFFS
nr:hypothetical protein [Tanacetum cinerariifolium]